MKKRNDKAFTNRREGEANPRAATPVNAIAASLTPPTSKPIQLELFPWRACPLEAKPGICRTVASETATERDGVEGGGTRGQLTKITGETPTGRHASRREVYKSEPRRDRPEAGRGVGGGHSIAERRENRREKRAATSVTCEKRGKVAELPPRGKAISRLRREERLDNTRKLQRTLYRAAKSQPQRKFPQLYGQIGRSEILAEAWRRVARNGGAAGVDKQSIAAVRSYGEERFLEEIRADLLAERYRAASVRRVHIPKPGQPGKTRPLGIPTVRDRVVQMAVKIVIEPLFEADFQSCAYGFRPKRTPRMALNAVIEGRKRGHHWVVDVDLKAYFDTIDHELLMGLVERRIADRRVLGLIRAWLRAGVLEEGKITHPERGTPQGGVISPVLANLFLNEVDRWWTQEYAERSTLVRYADDMVLLTRTEQEAHEIWKGLQERFATLRLTVNEDKSRLAQMEDGFAFLGFDIRARQGRLYMWPRAKAIKHLRSRIGEAIRAIPSAQPLGVLIKRLNPILNGWCTYFRVGNSNRVFHKVDRAARDGVHVWLRRKHRISWATARKRWTYRTLHEKARLYRMVGKVSHLEALR